MKKLVYNSENLTHEEIDEVVTRVKVFLVNSQNELLIANYGGIYLLPGGKVDNNESLIEALIRELKEETGIIYNDKELEYLCTLDYYQKNYPKGIIQ